MKKTIWKYSTLNNGFEERFTIQMPKGSEILCVQKDEKTIPT